MAEIYTPVKNDLLDKLKAEKKAAIEFQQRKHEDWNENYELYRNKTKTNRLTQRQAVNIPLMKETVKTLLSKIDDAPNVDWKERSGDEMKEIIYQEIWGEQFKTNKLEWLDVADKKNVLLYGLSTKMLNLNKDGFVVPTVLDTFDVLYDPLMNAMDIETARFVIRQNIYRSLRDILADPKYLTTGKDELKKWLTMKSGIVQTGVNKEEMEKKQERLKSMGVDSTDFDLFAGGDVVINLSEHFYLKWVKDQFVKYVCVYADDSVLLLDMPLFEVIGVDFWPFVVWGEDPETNDVYPDGVADLVRTPNKIVNIWFSQLVENRTLRNFQMFWYDATVQGYTPQTYEPGPGRMLPAPGKPSETLMPVEISGLDETLTAIEFLTRVVERGSGATAIDKGVSEKKQITLGEVNMLVGRAMERTVGMAKFYSGSWYELARKWDAMMQANATGKLDLYKTGRTGKLYKKTVYPSDWVSDAGYEPTVASTSEHEEEQFKGLTKWQAVLSQYPDNMVLRRISQKRQLEILDLTPQELKEVEDEEKRKMDAAMLAPVEAQAPQPGQGQPNNVVQDIRGQLAQMAQ